MTELRAKLAELSDSARAFEVPNAGVRDAEEAVRDAMLNGSPDSERRYSSSWSSR